MSFYISLIVNSIYHKRVNAQKTLAQLHSGDRVDEFVYFIFIVENHAGKFAISFLCF